MPRGSRPARWSCFGRYGSGGTTVAVTPGRRDLKSPGIAGVGIQASMIDSDISGRFTVADLLARVFPALRSLVDGVIAEGLLPASDFHIGGVFPADRLTYHSDRLLEYETASRAKGLGTYFQVLPSSAPIRGAVLVTPDAPH